MGPTTCCLFSQVHVHACLGRWLLSWRRRWPYSPLFPDGRPIRIPRLHVCASRTSSRLGLMRGCCSCIASLKDRRRWWSGLVITTYDYVRYRLMIFTRLPFATMCWLSHFTFAICEVSNPRYRSKHQIDSRHEEKQEKKNKRT